MCGNGNSVNQQRIKSATVFSYPSDSRLLIYKYGKWIWPPPFSRERRVSMIGKKSRGWSLTRPFLVLRDNRVLLLFSRETSQSWVCASVYFALYNVNVCVFIIEWPRELWARRQEQRKSHVESAWVWKRGSRCYDSCDCCRGVLLMAHCVYRDSDPYTCRR